MPYDNEMMMGDETMPSEDHRNPRRRARDSEQQGGAVGIHVVPEAHHALDLLVLQDNVRTEIATAIRSVVMADQMEAAWGLSKIRPMKGRCVINFYGPSGTGKSRCALAIALQLGKPLYQVDYSAIVSKYLGDTAKHIVQAFKQASESGSVLFFDEADSLLSRRVAAGESCSTSINQNRNTLMQELDRFNGIVIMTTNLFGNYDEAMLRRIARHVQFSLPDEAMRRQLFRLHLPNPERTPSDLSAVARAAHGLSGGDILNVCINAMEAASLDPDPALWKVSEELLMEHVRKIRSAKTSHSGQDRIAAPVSFN
jgi:SpoVK/Ycf46/Vps4 family AAA+-type ATPase